MCLHTEISGRHVGDDWWVGGCYELGRIWAISEWYHRLPLIRWSLSVLDLREPVHWAPHAVISLTFFLIHKGTWCSGIFLNHTLCFLLLLLLLLLDLAINCTVGSIMAEKSTSSFSQLCPCWQRDVLYILHENGCCSFRMKDRLRAPPSLPTSPGVFAQRDETYITYAFSDPIRLGRSAQVRLKLFKECASLQPTLV